MLEQFIDISVFFLVGALFVVVAVSSGVILRPNNPYPEKLAAYECGETPVGLAQVPVHIRYYIFALIFVVFEVETVFLYPWAVVFEQIGPFAFGEMMLFIGMLVVGLIYAWRKKVLKWA